VQREDEIIIGDDSASGLPFCCAALSKFRQRASLTMRWAVT